MHTSLQEGQTFAITNPDHYVTQEVWTIHAIAYPQITFSYEQYIVADIAYVQSFATGMVTGTIVSEVEEGVIVALFRRPAFAEAGILLAGDKAIFLGSLDPPRYL